MWEKTNQFWAAKEAWIAERSAYAGGVPATGSAEWGRYRFKSKRQRWANTHDFAIKGATWNSRAFRLVPIAQPPGKTITIDTNLVQELQNKLSDAGKMIAESFDAHFGLAMLETFNAWPWSTGVSKSYLELGYYTDGDTRFVAVMGCAVGYAIYVQDGEPAREMDRRVTLAAESVGNELLTKFGVV